PKGRREYIPCRLESGIPAGHTLGAGRWAACRILVRPASKGCRYREDGSAGRHGGIYGVS
ncbi:MAG: hypothetical protein WA970_26100, partial [Gammaproteobacteria bacterium]